MGKVGYYLRRVGLFCIKWRYVVALTVFVFCIVFKLHGSSIAEYNKMFARSEEYNTEELIAGNSRSIRSDEWNVHTPYYISQYYNDFEKDSHMVSMEGQDMIVGYNAPVADITAIAKPFTWGYLLLGNEYGLSWYWCSKLILLILVTFELCMIVTQKNKKVSVLGALMISFAPTVQWWFVPHMVDVFFWAMTVFVLAYHFFVAQGRWRILWAILLPCSVITFTLALFPSLQVAVGAAMIGLFIGIMLRDKKKITFKKRHVWYLVGMSVFIFGVLGFTIWTSREAISALLHTAYPGSRVDLGGNFGIKDLFTKLTTFTLPFKDITYSNNCETSTFIHFAPILLMMYPIIYKKMRRDKNIVVGNALVICLVVMIIFMLAGFPALLAKITLFSYVNRMDIAYGLVATIFTIWGIDMIWKKKVFSLKQVLGVLAIYVFLNICFLESNELSYLKGWQYAVIIGGLAILAYLMLRQHQNVFMVGASVLMIISGTTVNPVARGTSALFEHPLEKKMHEIASNDPEAYWLAVNDSKLAMLGIANGARMLNAVNFYPDYEKWRVIDPDGKNNDVYNRYAYIYVNLSENVNTEMRVVTPDSIQITMSCKETLKWAVRYLVTAGEVKEAEKCYNKVYDDSEGNYHIYKRM